MSLMIKGINLPDKGDVIHLEIYSDGSVWDKSNWEPHPPKASAIQIPKDHGRLIDADALETVFKDMAKCEWNQKVSPISWAYAFEDTIDEIDNAPTILEAEE